MPRLLKNLRILLLVINMQFCLLFLQTPPNNTKTRHAAASKDNRYPYRCTGQLQDVVPEMAVQVPHAANHEQGSIYYRKM